MEEKITSINKAAPPEENIRPVKLIFVVGRPSSGKTTRAKKLKEEHFDDYFIIHADFLWDRMAEVAAPKPVKDFDINWIHFVEKVILMNKTHDTFIIDGASLSPEGGISAATFFNRASVELFLEFFELPMEYTWEIHKVTATYEECINHDWEKPRSERHGRNYIRTYYKNPTFEQMPMIRALQRMGVLDENNKLKAFPQ